MIQKIAKIIHSLPLGGLGVVCIGPVGTREIYLKQMYFSSSSVHHCTVKLTWSSCLAGIYPFIFPFIKYRQLKHEVNSWTYFQASGKLSLDCRCLSVIFRPFHVVKKALFFFLSGWSISKSMISYFFLLQESCY